MKNLRTVLITGATSGIGLSLALQYAQPGTTLVLHGRDDAMLDAVAAACRQQGATTKTLLHDLGDHVGWMEKLAHHCATTPVDLALVNAGVAHTSVHGIEPWEDVQHMLDVNLRAAMATVTVLAAAMCQRGSGQIALVSSLAAYVGLPLTPAYCASKAGLKAYGEAMRGRLAPYGVGVCVVMPGFVKTGMSDRFAAAKPSMVSSEWAARRIQRGLLRNPARLAFPQPLALGMWCLSVLPPSWSQFILGRLGYAAAPPTTPGAKAD